MKSKLVIDLIITMFSGLSISGIYNAKHQSQLDLINLSPSLLIYFSVILLSFFYFFCLRSKATSEIIHRFKNLSKNNPTLSTLLILMIGSMFMLSFRFEHRFEYVKIGQMQVLIEFRLDRWSNILYWVKPPTSNSEHPKSTKKYWTKFPIEAYNQDIEGVWHPRKLQVNF